MSVVTDIILITAIEDGAAYDGNGSPYANADKLNAFFEPKKRMVKLDDQAGGPKAMQCDVFMGAMNAIGFDLADFLEHFHSIPWEYPECVQLLIKEEHDDIFTVHTP